MSAPPKDICHIGFGGHALNLAYGFTAICAITKFSNAALLRSNDNSIDSLLDYYTRYVLG